ncbi:MAG: alpha-amylase family glycosyl hydrolase [Phycisphaerales bacterium]
MFSRPPGVIRRLFVAMASLLAAPAWCIQPPGVTAEVVHVGERLVDVTMVPTAIGVTIERTGSSASPRWLVDEAGWMRSRLRLEADERLRIRIGSGEPGEWFDPLAETQPEPEALETPGWALGAVWYNIFPERFDDANPANNQGWPHGTPVPWTADWFEVSADEFEASANRAIASPQRYGDDHERRRPPLRETVFERRFGGDLEGVVRRLDHIADLGATAIWLCPVFASTSLHKYDAADHRHIDPWLAGPGPTDALAGPGQFDDPATWSWTEADRVLLDRLLPAARERGMRVILDGVWNHVGLAHPAFVDAASRGPASPYFDWFEIVADRTGQAVSWRAWDRRNGNLPVFRQHAGNLAPGPIAHVDAVTRRWMDPNGDGDPSDGVDGWRLDVANEVPLAFWSHWRSLVRSINPDAALFGELWFDGSDYFGGRAFDAQMNYPLAFALTAWLGRDPAFDARALSDALDRVYRHHPATHLAQMNLLSSHDTPRLASMLANPGREYDRSAGLGDDGFNRGRPSDEVYDRIELAYAVLAVMPGSPMLYNGDELGMWGADDPENRKPLAWPGLVEDRPTHWPTEAHAEAMTQRLGLWLRLRSDPSLGGVLRFGRAAWHAEGPLLVIDRQLDDRRVRLIANPEDTAIRWEQLEVPARGVLLLEADFESGLEAWRTISHTLR